MSYESGFLLVNLDSGSPIRDLEVGGKVERQRPLHLDFTIQLTGSNLEFILLTCAELFWTLMSISQVRSCSPVRQSSRLTKEFQVPRLPIFLVPLFRRGPRFPGSLSPVSFLFTYKKPERSWVFETDSACV